MGAVAIVLLTILLVFMILATIWMVYRYIMGGPKHIEEYFEANFRTLIGEWDLVAQPRLGAWRSGMMTKLKGLDKSISAIEGSRVKIDKRLTGLERSLSRLDVRYGR